MKKLSNVQEAIEEAIEGGYTDHILRQALIDSHPTQEEFEERKSYFAEQFANSETYKNKAFLDPLFWQALGKARGWPKYVMGHCGQDANLFEGKRKCCWYGQNEMEWFVTGYAYWAIKWFETRLSNGDETNYWQSLP